MGRNTTSRRCRQCKAAVLVGLDGDLCAFPTTADPTPLSPLGEALALLAGRATLHLRATPDGGRYLDRRDRWQIQGEPAGTANRLFPFDVVAAHVCHSPPLPSIPTNLPDKPEARKDQNNAGTLLEQTPY